MATHMPVSVQWESPLRQLQCAPSSFLHNHTQRLKLEIIESRRAFLNFHNNEVIPHEMEITPKKPHVNKKISFKIKKTPSIYRKISDNKVAELTQKFNTIQEKNCHHVDKVRKCVKRMNSVKSVDGEKKSAKNVTRKPSVKTKPVLNHEEILKIKRKNRDNNKECIRAKMGYLEIPKKPDEVVIRPTSLPLFTGGSVKAAIQIFEQKTSPINNVPIKPLVPEKRFLIKSDLVQKPVLPPKVSPVKPNPPRPSTDTKPHIKPNTKTVKSEQEEPQNDAELGVFNSNEEIKPSTESKPNIIPEVISYSEQLDHEFKPSTESSINNENLKSNNIQKKPDFTNKTKLNADIKPNTSFLWSINKDKTPSPLDCEGLYDLIEPNHEEPKTNQEKIYEELNIMKQETYDYEEIKSNSVDQDNDGYEYCSSPKENIYEILPPLLPRRQEPLPPRPPSRSSTHLGGENTSNCYESIYNPGGSNHGPYESIYGCQIGSWGSNRDSLVSDQQSNSLYGRASLVMGWTDGVYNGKAGSDLSWSDRSDDWVDVTDNEENGNNNSSGLIM